MKTINFPGGSFSSLLLAAMILMASGCSQEPTDDWSAPDPYLWLENIDGDSSMNWVSAMNTETRRRLSDRDGYEQIYRHALRYYESRDRLPNLDFAGDMLYSHWQDGDHPRGLWRRIKIEDFNRGKENWQVVLDLDSLSHAEGRNWVFKGAYALLPDRERWLVYLSNGGKDAVEIREFSTSSMTFPEGGFYLPEAKGGANWLDSNRIIAATEFVPGAVTESGYPQQVRILERGQDPTEAEILLEIPPQYMGVWASVLRNGDETVPYIETYQDFYTHTVYFLRNGRAVKLDLPPKSTVFGISAGRLILQLKEDGAGPFADFRSGDLIGIEVADITGSEPKAALILRPGVASSLNSLYCSDDFLIAVMLEDVVSRMYRLDPSGTGWQKRPVPAPDMATIEISAFDGESGKFYYQSETFIEPSSLVYCDGGTVSYTVRSMPAFFDPADLEISRNWAVSKDGTRVPYFLVSHSSDARNGESPTLLYGYGGFEIAQTPFYSPGLGFGWMARGGTFVLANIRGGGEFGPDWHRQALRENRQKSFDDFIAVAEDLIDRKITSSSRLAIQGGSNGGLLVGAVTVQRPELFGAVVCRVPLLDMKRYHKLLAGASWMAEYGDPDSDDSTFIRKYSPYQNLKKNTEYPPIFLNTSTRDDRVHPGHARKTAAKMKALGSNVYYFENVEGGHAASVTPEQKAETLALLYTFLWNELR